LRLAQVIDFAHLIKFPDEALDFVVTKISENPDNIELRLKELKEKREARFVDDKVKALFPSLVPPPDDPNRKSNSGLVISPDMTILSENLGQQKVQITSDVVYLGRKNLKPEIVYSDHLNGAMRMSLVQLNSSQYPETARLVDHLRRFDEWKRKTLRNIYLTIGDEQREYFEELDKTRFHIFKQQDLAEKIDISWSTVSRLIANRYAESRGINGNLEILATKDLCITADKLLRYSVTPLINAVFEKEFSERMAYSDQEINGMVPNVARRTIAKYRFEAGIPSHGDRVRSYRTGEKTEPFKIQ